MDQCPVCQAPVLEGSLFCDECGAPLFPGQEGVLGIRRGRLYLPRCHIQLELEGPGRWVLGRDALHTTDALHGVRFIDLSPCGAYQYGVSRRHALLEITPDGRALLTDLGSTNGTRVDHVRLQPHQPYPLPLVARLRLGRLELEWQGLA